MTLYKIDNNVHPSGTTFSRQQMLLWINDTLQAEFSKIEQLGDGAAYCLLTKVIFPSAINLARVKWNGRSDLDSIDNWKLLNTTWTRIGITKEPPVTKLTKKLFQDNFDFLVWFKAFYDAHYNGQAFDPVALRGGIELPKENKIKSHEAQALRLRHGIIPTTDQSRQSMRMSIATNFAPPSMRAHPTMPNLQHGRIQERIFSRTPLQHNPSNSTKPMVSVSNPPMGTPIVPRGNKDLAHFYSSKLREIKLLCDASGKDGTVEVAKLSEILDKTEPGCIAPVTTAIKEKETEEKTDNKTPDVDKENSDGIDKTVSNMETS